MKLQQLLSYTRKAVDDYQMIQDGDRIAIGISGGKDSLTLLYALSNLRRFYPKKYELEAITVSMGYEEMDFSAVAALCKELNVNFTMVDTQIAEILLSIARKAIPVPSVQKCVKAHSIVKQKN